MKSTARIVCCAVTLAWFHGAIAANGTTEVKPPSRGIPVKPHYVKEGDLSAVNNRLVNRGALTKKRAALAKKEAQAHKGESQALGKAQAEETAKGGAAKR